MILSWALIGTIVGLLLGLTGAGGAVIAVPLFVHFVGTTLRDATALSLVAVLSGAALNWLIQKKETDYKTGTLLFLFSIAGSYLFRSIKAAAPEWVILASFIGVGALSLLGTWGKLPKRASPIKATETQAPFAQSALSGFGLGALITMTGLGGGVILVPLLTGPFRMRLSRAAATSLYTILLSSASALVLQWHLLPKVASAPHLATLAAGSATSALMTKKLLASIASDRMDLVRKLIISAVILFSTISLI